MQELNVVPANSLFSRDQCVRDVSLDEAGQGARRSRWNDRDEVIDVD